MQDPLYKDSFLGITPPTLILFFEAHECRSSNSTCGIRETGSAQMNPWQARRLEADSDKALGIYQILKHPKYIFG